MANSRAGAIINGLKTAQTNQRPLAEGGISPLLASYQQWTMGRGSHQGLPRDFMEFLAGAFGPLTPMVPTGLDQPPPSADRSEPRRFPYPVGWNLPHSVPGSEGLKLADFAILRMYADLYSVARSCIQLRKAEIRGLEWEIRPTPAAAKAMKGDKEAHRDFADRKKKAEAFFRRPDPDYQDFSSWLDALLEDVFVIDALSLYLHPTRMPGKGLLGSDLAALELIAGETIRPMLDIHGGRPKAPNPAYQQYLYGVPRVDLMTLLTGEDVQDLDGPVKKYRGDQLLYLPFVCRTWTPYGFPPIERAIIPTLTGLRKQQFQLNYFDEGTVPAAYISPGENSGWTPSQVRELQDGLNAIAGDPAWKHRILCLPPGSRVDPQHQAELADMMDEIVMTQVCMAFDVQPMELGISPRVSSTQSSGAANQMAKASQDTQERKATKPLLIWLKRAIFDTVLRDVCGQDDMQYLPEGLEEDEDEETQTNLIVQQVSNALKSIDEGRDELGMQPWGTEESSQPGFITATGWVPLKAPEPPPMGVPGLPGQQPPPAGGGAGTRGAPPAPCPGGGGGRGAGPAAPPSTPQHAAAAAAQRAAPGRPQASAKAALAELDALRRHTVKGRDPAEWGARYLPGWAVAEFRFQLKAGQADAAGAADVVKGMLAEVPGHEGSQGPFPREYGDPHVYARDVHSGAGNCVCGAALADPVHVEAAPGVEVPGRMAVLAGPKGDAAPAAAKDFTATSPVTLAPYDLEVGRRRRRRRRRAAEKAEPKFPGWRYDRDLVAHYTAQLTALDEQAVHQIIGSLVAQGVVKAAGERYRRMAELALAGWYRRIRVVLRNLWTEAWHLGRRSGHALATAGPVDWGAWTPGDPHAAAILTDGDTALRAWLDHYGVPTIRSIAQTRYGELAEVLADALEHGAGVDELGRQIRDQFDVRSSRARMIAATEVARAVSQATLQSYRDSDLVDMVEWSSADDARVCKICDANEAQGPVPVGGTFLSGQDAPPAHPHCRCAPIPAFDLLAGLGPYDQPVGKAGVPRTADTPSDAALAERGREYWLTHIPWGSPGDFDKCVEQVVEHAHMTPAQAKGYCNLLHHRALGYYPATHAAMERGHKYTDLSGQGLVKIQDEANRTTADDVYALLAETYPGRVLGWVKDAVWTGPRDVPLSTIDLGWRPGGRDPKKVRAIEAQLAERGPRSFEPVVLVDTPEAEKFAIADGYHRALAFQHAGESDIRAYVGTVTTENGPWDRAMHDAKLNKGAPTC